MPRLAVKTIWFPAVLLLAVVCLTGCSADSGRTISKSEYPPARVDNVVDTLFGQPVADPYRWLENGDSAEAQAWTKAENDLSQRILHAIPVREKLKARLTEIWNYPRTGVPYKYGKYYFYTKNDGLQNHDVLYVKEGLEGEPRVVIDPNKFSEDGTVAMDFFYPSKDGSLIVYGVSKSGSENSTIMLRNTITGADLPDTIPNCKYSSVTWQLDNSAFYYTRHPEPGSVPAGDEEYYEKLFLHKVGGDYHQDQLIYERPDNKVLSFSAQLGEDGRYLLLYISAGSGRTNELHYMDLRKPGPFKPIITGFEHAYYAAFVDSTLYVTTNENADNFKVMKVDLNHPERANWSDLIPESADILQYASIIDNKLFVTYMHNACDIIKVFGYDGQLMHEVPLPDLGSIGGVSGKWDEPEMFFAFSSFTVPNTIYSYDIRQGQPTVYFTNPIKVDPTPYTTEQVWYNSKDGTKVSMFIVHRKDLVKDGKTPCMLYGYGGFTISLQPYFSTSRYLWLERGGILAIPNLRGGGEYGEKWHKAGMLGNKQNVFDDFIAAAEWLIANKYTNKDKLAISGGSNGGLLTGAVLVQRPDLCRAVICAVPLLDMVRYHMFRIARFWIPEYGSSEDSAQFKFLYAYSPYHHVAAGVKYPAVYFTAGESDGRVDPLHARKMTALLQRETTGRLPILLYVEPKAGHGQGKPTTKQIEEVADEYAFLMWQLGMDK